MEPDYAIKKIQEFIDCDGIEKIDIVTLITAQNALKKQIPKKPVEMCNRSFVCGCCKQMVIHHQSFCDICGQAIDWSDKK